MDEEVKNMLVKLLEGQEGLKIKIEDLSKGQEELKTEVGKISMDIENEIKPKLNASLEGHRLNSEHMTVIDDKIDRLQIDINNISMKTTYNDSRIIEISKDIRKAR